MLKFQICQSTTNVKNCLCAYPQCLNTSHKASIDCFECLVNKHKHDQDTFVHLLKLPLIIGNSQKNMEDAVKKLEGILEQTQNNQKLIQEQFRGLLKSLQTILKQIEEIILNRIKSMNAKVLRAQRELQNLFPQQNMQGEYQFNVDEYEEQWRELTIFAITDKENILPNLNILNLETNDIQDLLQVLKSAIENIAKNATQISKTMDNEEQIQLYDLKVKTQYIPCPTHKDQIQEYICIDCNDNQLGCRKCMNIQIHQRHNIIKQSEKEEIEAARQSALKDINKRQIETSKNWDVYIETLTQSIQKELKDSFQERLKQSFGQIMNYSTKDSLKCSDILESFKETQQSIQKQIEIKLNTFIIETLLLKQQLSLQQSNSQVSCNVMIKTLQTGHYQELKIDQKFQKSIMKKLIEQGKEYLIGIMDNTNKEYYKYVIRLKDESDFHGLHEDYDNFILGSQSNHVKFEKSGIFLTLKNIVIKDQSIQNVNSFTWKLLKYQI